MRQAASRKRKSILPKTEEDEIKKITEDAAKVGEEIPPALSTRSHTRSPPATGRGSRAKLRRSIASVGSYEHTPPPVLVPWLLISVPLVIWDTAYVLGRPHTMPGGTLHDLLFKPYAMYGTVDYNYGFPAWDAKSGFTGAQGFMNAIETVLYVWYLVVIGTRVASGDGFFRGVALKSVNVLAPQDSHDHAKIVVRGGWDVATAVVACFAGAVMTLSKTALYFMNEYYSGWAGIRHNDWVNLYAFWLPLNAAWLVLPSYMCYVLGKEIVEAMSMEKGGRRSRRRDDGD